MQTQQDIVHVAQWVSLESDGPCCRSSLWLPAVYGYAEMLVLRRKAPDNCLCQLLYKIPVSLNYSSTILNCLGFLGGLEAPCSSPFKVLLGTFDLGIIVPHPASAILWGLQKTVNMHTLPAYPITLCKVRIWCLSTEDGNSKATDAVEFRRSYWFHFLPHWASLSPPSRTLMTWGFSLT